LASGIIDDFIDRCSTKTDTFGDLLLSLSVVKVIPTDPRDQFRPQGRSACLGSLAVVGVA